MLTDPTHTTRTATLADYRRELDAIASDLQAVLMRHAVRVGLELTAHATVEMCGAMCAAAVEARPAARPALLHQIDQLKLYVGTEGQASH